MNFKKYHRSISLGMLIITTMFIVDFWLSNTWSASLWNKDSWIYIEKNLHFYSSVALIGWILFLAFKFLMVVEEEILDIEPYYHPISKLKVANNNHPEVHKEIEEHEGKAIFYNENNNKQNAVQKMIDETSFNKDDLNRMEGSYKTESNKALKSALSFKPGDLENKPKENKKEIPNFLSKDKPVEKNNIENISSRLEVSTAEVLNNKKLKSFKIETINQIPVEFFATDSKDIYLAVKFSNKNEILVNEKENKNDTQPRFWFTKNSRVESPISKLNSMKKSVESIISEVLPKTTKVNVNALLILENTQITNVEKAKDAFKRNNIKVVSNDISEKDFPLLEKVLKYNKEEINSSFVEFIETLIKYFDQQEKLKAA